MRYFVLQGIDAALDMPLFETRFAIDDIEQLRSILGDCASDDPDLIRAYGLDEDEIVAINTEFGTAYISHGRETMLTPWHSSRTAPYLIHTGFELPLMLEGRKPMAVFGDVYPADWLDETERRFEAYFMAGRIEKRVHERPLSPLERSRLPETSAHLRTVYFILPGEGWRIDGHIMLSGVFSKGVWHDRLARAEGSLLGYSEEQNDWWMAFRRDAP